MRWERERFQVIDRVRKTIRRWGMVAPGDLVVVAVSGGADSLVLLDVLVQLASDEGISLRVLHVDHGLRPESAQEAEYVGEAARRYGLPFRAVRVKVESSGASDMSPEEAARKARYRAFEEELKDCGAKRLATGHTADDRVETLLLRLFTGAGPRGLAGIPPVRGPYIRPLIRVWREEVETYARFLPLTPLRDPTNRDTNIPRNRVRHLVLPLLEDRFPGVRKVLLREAETLEEIWEYLEAEARAAEREGVRKTEEGMEVDAAFLLSLPAAVRRELTARLLRSAGVETDYHILEDILYKLAEGEGSATLDLGKGRVARREYGRLILGPTTEAGSSAGEASGEEVLVPGEGGYLLPAGGGRLELEIISRSENLNLSVFSGKDDPRVAWLDAERLVFPLRLRGIRPGDRFRPLGAPGSRKLQDFLVDLKVPRRERGRVVILESAGEIAWVVGYRIDDRFKVTPKTKKILRGQVLFF